MNHKSCTAYRRSIYGAGTTKLRSYMGADTVSRDSAMCAALVNNDHNHFYFCNPDLAPKTGGTKSCFKCGCFCSLDFCSSKCKSEYSIDQIQAETFREYFNQYRFALL